jgi:hypothetical protein
MPATLATSQHPARTRHADNNQPRSRFTRLNKYLENDPLVGRSHLYGLAAKHPGLFRKSGDVVLLDLDMLEQIFEGLPPAKIKQQRKA